MADSPRLTRAKREEHAERDKRLARALRDNLHRRKQQAAARRNAPPSRRQIRPPASRRLERYRSLP
jgi:hypothetical protein